MLIGDSAVGKSSVYYQYCDNTFTNQETISLLLAFKIKKIELDGQFIKLQIVSSNLQYLVIYYYDLMLQWDTAGQERFRTLATSYYRSAHGIIVIYDVTDLESFNNVKLWLHEIDKYANEKVNKVLVGNKCDLENKRVVTFEQGKEFADSLGIEFIETSAKNAVNIDKAFTKLSQSIRQRLLNNPLDTSKSKLKVAPVVANTWFSCW